MLSQLDIYTYPQNLNNALELIKGAVEGEREDELFYNYLISLAPTHEVKEIIVGIRDDEMKHNKMFRTIYYQLTNQVLTQALMSNFVTPKSFCEGITRALKGELAAVQRYRQILFAMQNRIHINMITEIITDELRHANLYNYLYSENCHR
jgi:rubrerythrin